MKRRKHTADGNRAPKPLSGRPRGGASAPYWIYGAHAVRAALANAERRKFRLLMTEQASARMVPPPELQLETVTGQDLARFLSPDCVHQGLALETAPLPVRELGQILEQGDVGRRRLILLDQVSDPQNVGAIVRNAAAFGVSALIMTRRHAPPESGALAKAASGALESVPIIRVGNLSQSLEVLARHGFWRIGLTGHASQTLAQAMGDQRICIVLGAEGEGMRQNTEAHCDELAKLPISHKVESLNVSNAAAIALYAVAAR